MLDFIVLAQQCAPVVDVRTMTALVRVESGFNPYAIGVVGGKLERQPRNLPEAIATAQSLEANGYNYSVGLSQVNRYNFSKYGLTRETAFDPCSNLTAGAQILSGCFTSAKGKFGGDQDALRAALSCYYSGNYTTGFKAGYVQRVVANATDTGVKPIPVVPAISKDSPTLKVKGGELRRAKRSADGEGVPVEDGPKRDPEDAVVF
jgi:type IV secretion system protein VirB1